jgi:predicted Zn-dependent protease
MFSLAILGLSLALAQPPQAQGAFILRGMILAPSAQATDRVEVVLERSQDRVVARTTSDSNGSFEFRNIEAGRYDVVVRVDGYDDARELVDVGSNIETQMAAVAAAEGQEQPAQPEVMTGIANVYVVLHKKGSPTPAAENDPEYAAITELSRKYPKKVLQEYEKAVEFSRKGDAAHALERYESVSKLAPDFYYGHISLGNMYLKAERYRDAEREYNLAHKSNPKTVQPLLNLGKLYLQEADANFTKGQTVFGRILDQALDAFEEATKLDPSSAMAHFLLGAAYYKSDFSEDAETNLKRALDLDANMGAARLMLANVYAREEKWDNALRLLDEYLAKNPNTQDRAQVQEMRSSIEKSLQDRDRKPAKPK